MITVRLDSPLRPPGGGEQLSFTADKERIVIGRSPDCDVPLHPDLTKLGRHHFEIRRAAGGLELVTDREHPVFASGQRVIGTRALLPLEELRLLDPVAGPAVHVSYSKTQAGFLTEKDALQDAGTLQGKMGGLRKGVLGLAAAVAIIALAFGTYFIWVEWQRRNTEQAYLADMQALSRRMADAEAANVDWMSVYDRVRPSIYQVTFAPSDGSPPLHQGTAWVYGPHTLATNAHVAKLFNTPKLQGRLLLVPAGEGLPAVPVLGVTLHPAYAAYRQAAADSKQEGARPPLATLGSYDVAFLKVAEDAKLGPQLTLAASAPQPGESVAYLGYPERCALHPGQLHIKPGIVSGVSDFLGTNAGDELIYHTAPGTGGASGSPLLNAKGDAIGVFSGGESAQPVAAVAAADAQAATSAQKTCVASGSATLYAQNVSLLREIEDGSAEKRQAARALQWRNSAFYNLNQDRVWSAVAAVSEASSPGDSGYDAQSTSVELAAHGVEKSASGAGATTFRNVAAGEYVAFADVPPEARVTLMAYAGGNQVHVPVLAEGRPSAVFDLAEAGDVVLALTGPAGQTAKVVLVRLDEDASAQQ